MRRIVVAKFVVNSLPTHGGQLAMGSRGLPRKLAKYGTSFVKPTAWKGPDGERRLVGLGRLLGPFHCVERMIAADVPAGQRGGGREWSGAGPGLGR
jgi:hypothetical protein